MVKGIADGRISRLYGAGDGNRTHAQCLGSVDSIICLVLG
jgi:hypothetical protein